MPTPTRRRGVVLPAVLAVMVIIGIAASGALFMSRHERGASRSARLETLVIAAADQAQVDAVNRFSHRASSLAIGESVLDPAPVSAPGVEATARLTRLGQTLFVLVVDAQVRDARGAAARRTTSTVLHASVPAVEFRAALTLMGADEPPPATADGSDRDPAGLSCESEPDDAPDTIHPLDAGSDSVAIVQLRHRAMLQLAGGATVSMPGPVVRDGRCDTSAVGNWGDPPGSGACAPYFPVVHVRGDLAVTGGMGQGILLVDGDLDVSGGFEFVGAIIVGGDLAIGAGGTTMTGGVRAHRVLDPDAGSRLAPTIVRSTCALRAALLGASVIAPVRDRAWALER